MIYMNTENPKPFFATVWTVEKNQYGFVKGRITTSKKIKDTEDYENTTWFVTFGQNCKDKALGLKEKDRISVDAFSIENPSVKLNDGTYKNYLNLSIHHFEMLDGSQKSEKPSTKGSSFPKPKAPITEMKALEADDEPLPFDL